MGHISCEVVATHIAAYINGYKRLRFHVNFSNEPVRRIEVITETISVFEMNAMEILTRFEDFSSLVTDTTLTIFHLSFDLLVGCTATNSHTHTQQSMKPRLCFGTCAPHSKVTIFVTNFRGLKKKLAPYIWVTEEPVQTMPSHCWPPHGLALALF